MRRSLSRTLAVFFACAAALVPVHTYAQETVVTRNVTVRESPNRSASKIEFVAPGDRLELLDGGERQAGYFHVRLPDTRTGWVYQTFVRRDAADALLPVASALAPDQMRAHFINVDQGNAALLEFPCAAVLIDAGGRGDAAARHLVSYIGDFFRRRPDLRRRLAAVFVTHTHIDHNSNLRRLIDGRYQVGSYIHNGILTGSGRADARWMAGYVGTTSPRIQTQPVSQSDVEAAGRDGFTNSTIDPVACPAVDPVFRILSGGRSTNPGWSAKDFENGNNHSITIRVDFGSTSFLFPGDLENAGIADLLQRYRTTSTLNIDMLAVSHHGAENGTSKQLLDVLSPSIAVISMGPSTVREQWTAYAYGHPRKRTVDALYQSISTLRQMQAVPVATAVRTFNNFNMDRAIYATGWDGDIVFLADASGRITKTP